MPLKIYMPYGPECVNGDDTLIPGPPLFKDFIIPIHHTYPNKGSDVMEMWNGKLSETHPILHMSICVDVEQVFIHIINLGKIRAKGYKPGNTMPISSVLPADIDVMSLETKKRLGKKVKKRLVIMINRVALIVTLFLFPAVF